MQVARVFPLRFDNALPSGLARAEPSRAETETEAFPGIRRCSGRLYKEDAVLDLL